MENVNRSIHPSYEWMREEGSGTLANVSREGEAHEKR